MTEKNQNDSHEKQDTKSIQVKLGLTENRVFDLGHGARLISILDIIAAERECGIEELALFRDGEDGPLTAMVLIEANYPHKRRHHVHHASDVEVTVYYQGHDKKRTFKRNAIVEAVLLWAIAAFNVDPSMASEFELTRHGHLKEELPEHEHIGHLAGRECELALDLVRGDIANGGCA